MRLERAEDLRRTLADLRAIIEGIADAVTAQAADGRLVYVNDAAVRLLGFADADEMLAAPPGMIRERFDMVDEDGVPIPLEMLPGRRALAGERPDQEGILGGNSLGRHHQRTVAMRTDLAGACQGCRWITPAAVRVEE